MISSLLIYAEKERKKNQLLSKGFFIQFYELDALNCYSFPDCCKRTKQVYDQILGDMKKAPESTLALMLNAAEFEFRLKELFKTV